MVTAKRINALRLRRVSLGLTQKDIASHLGLGVTRINHFEQGYIPPLKHRKKYAEVLQFSLDRFESVLDGTSKIKVTFE